MSTNPYNQLFGANVHISDSLVALDQGKVATDFDAHLWAPQGARQQLQLKIVLRLRCRAMAPKPIPTARDANGKTFWTTAWNAGNWQNFLRAADQQAKMWNNKFWLVPPKLPWMFSEFDVGIDREGKRVWRPNISCELKVQWEVGESAHRTIEVHNLDQVKVSWLNPGAPLDASIFRSHALLFDSLDATPRIFPLGPAGPARAFDIAHEIGHALGLAHIGVLEKTNVCIEAAVRYQLNLPPLNANQIGGTNSIVCYHQHQPADPKADNIMGVGDKFTVVNGRPWLWAMRAVREKMVGFYQAGHEHPFWQVVIANPGAGSWINK